VSRPGPVLPTVHLNGTSAEALAEALTVALEKLWEAQQALQDAAPNGRDYYPQGPALAQLAQEQHRQRAEALQDIRTDLATVLDSVLDQQQRRQR
jgi:hypothetical protein